MFTRAVVLLVLVCATAFAADHRDAPLASLNPAGDITDVFAFIDPQDSSRVVLTMGLNSFAVPAVSSTYIFSPEFLYQFKIDNNGDAVEDLVIQVVFDKLSGQTLRVIGPVRPQLKGSRNRLMRNRGIEGAAGAVFGSSSGLLAFAGLRDDPFVVDIGQFNRILNGSQVLFRAATLPVFGDLPGRQVRSDGTSGVNAFGGFNATFISVSLPKEWLRGASSQINVWATVSRPLVVINRSGEDDRLSLGVYEQFERMGQQLTNTVFIPRAMKDQFNADSPVNDMARYSGLIPDALTSNDATGNTIAGRAGLLDFLGLTALPAGAPLLLPANFANTDKNLIRKAILPDVLRLNLDKPWDDLAIGQFGLQNGRRYEDDIVDIALLLLRQLADVNFPPSLGVPGSGAPRAGALNFGTDARVFVVLQGTDWIEPDSQVGGLGIGGSGNDRGYETSFPYLPFAHPLPGAPGTVGFPPQN